MITNRMFIGEEVEGPQKGICTLFIPKGSLVSTRIDALYKKVIHLHITRFYFGAGDDTGVNKKAFDLINLLLKNPEHSVLVEFTLKDLTKNNLITSLADTVELILVLKDKRLQFPVSHIKFVNETSLYWHTVCSVYKNEINDTQYENDKLFEI